MCINACSSEGFNVPFRLDSHAASNDVRQDPSTWGTLRQGVGTLKRLFSLCAAILFSKEHQRQFHRRNVLGFSLVKRLFKLKTDSRSRPILVSVMTKGAESNRGFKGTSDSTANLRGKCR